LLLCYILYKKCFEKSTSLTKDKLAIGYSDSAGLKKAVGKAIWKDGSSEEEIKTQYYGIFFLIYWNQRKTIKITYTIYKRFTNCFN